MVDHPREPCLAGSTALSAPIFQFGGQEDLIEVDSYTREGIPDGQLAMTGPSAKAEPGHLPVRGDLAHIKLAGRYFVPHYAVPMPQAIASGGAALRKLNRADAEVVADLPAGGTFDVLDIAGGWAWGQYGEDGPVGYVALTSLAGQ